MNNRISQKEIEKRQLKVFRDLYSGFPEGRVIASEEPDFIVHASIKVGIELTSLFWGEGNNHIPRQAQENIRYKICQKAREEYEKRCSPKIHVSVHFNEQFTLKKQDISSLAIRVVDFIGNNMPSENEIYEEEYDWNNRYHFPKEINAISIYRCTDLTKSCFSAPDSGYIPYCTDEDVKRVLTKKESKYDNYLRKCNEVWLLININNGGISSTFDIPESTVDTKYKTRYDKVFLIQHRERRLFELSTQLG